MKTTPNHPAFLFKKRITANKKFSIKRFSPFLLLTLFFIFYFFYMIVAKTETLEKIIALPFLIANMSYIDFAFWKYFQGKKRGFIWVIESLISALITYFFRLY